MNEIVNRFLLTGDKFIPEKHLKQSAALDKLRFTYTSSRLSTKTKKEYKNLKKQDIHSIFIKTNYNNFHNMLRLFDI